MAVKVSCVTKVFMSLAVSAGFTPPFHFGAGSIKWQPPIARSEVAFDLAGSCQIALPAGLDLFVRGRSTKLYVLFGVSTPFVIVLVPVLAIVVVGAMQLEAMSLIGH